MAVTDPLITFAELTARPGFANVDQVEAEELIEDASAHVREVANPVELDPAVGIPRAVKSIVVQMVRRGFDNPRGLTGEQLGDYGWQAQSAGPSGTILPTRRETKLIRRAVNKLGVNTLQLQGDLPLRDQVFGFEDELLGSL